MSSLPGEVYCKCSFGLDFEAFPPKFELRVDVAVELEVFGFRVECTDRRMMAHLFTEQSEVQVVPVESRGKQIALGELSLLLSFLK